MRQWFIPMRKANNKQKKKREGGSGNRMFSLFKVRKRENEKRKEKFGTLKWHRDLCRS